MADDERLAVFIDYDNLALGARDHLGGMTFDFGPIADALAVRGRTLVRRAYADWSYFSEDRRALTRHQVELIEMPQRMGMARKNAADIKMVVDAIEMAFSRDYISTFVICSGDSDFSPLVHKLRELDRRVIGIGVESSTSNLLPPACDEFLFYDRLEGVESGSGRTARARRSSRPTPEPATGGDVTDETVATPSGRSGRGRFGGSRPEAPAGSAGRDAGTAPDRAGRTGGGASPARAPEPDSAPSPEEGAEERDATAESLEARVARTVASAASAGGTVTASVLKRALLRLDPTFSESDLGFRSFGEVLRHLAERGVVELSDGPAVGDPEVSLPESGPREQAFGLLSEVVGAEGAPVPLSGLKDRMRKDSEDFTEKALGYRSFLQFARSAQAVGLVDLRWDDDAGDYLVTV